MSLFITSLNSGSNGNAYYIGNQSEAILVDAGISCRETERRMERLGLSMERVKAIFISHEHGDHIRGVSVLSKKYNLPVYITPATLKNSGFKLADELNKNFTAGESIAIGELQVTPFKKFHDASDPHSFIVESKGIKIGVFTDLGVVCPELSHYFKQCHAAFLEANYDENMLENGRYPFHLKNRIRNGQGHLSNKQALELVLKHKPAFMSHLLLSHLSKNNNSPGLVYELFLQNAGNTHIVIASRDEETNVFEITDNFAPAPIQKKRVMVPAVQMSLF
ncbi:MAG: fold metallo-hydrolase [Bacteroidetes bacterium]|nr:fold metallo-hydrolase [Bacteroidota bacterium]